MFRRIGLLRGQTPRCAAVLVAAMVLFCGWCCAADQTRDKLQFDVFLGFDSVVPQNCWMPATFEIKNDGAPINGIVELRQGAGSDKGTEYRIPVELPTGTLKRVTLPIFVTGSYPVWTARLFNQNKRVLAEKIAIRPQQQVPLEFPILGSFSRTHAGHPHIEPVLQNYAYSQPASVRLLPQLFPEEPMALEGLTSIYLNSERAVDLNSKQVEALLEWLRRGGRLILALEQPQDLDGSPWLKKMVPFQSKGFTEIQAHDALHQWITGDWPQTRALPPGGQIPVAGNPKNKKKTTDKGTAEAPFAKLEEDADFRALPVRVVNGVTGAAKIEIAAGKVPLLFESSYGMGKVVTLTFSPEREPFRSWKHLPVFWARMAEIPRELYYQAADYNSYSEFSVEGVIGAMLETPQVRKLPIAAMFLMLLAYMGIIGPIDYLLVRRLNRPMLTWLTFPCYVVAFAGVIYLVGFRLRAGELEWNELNVVDVLASQPEAPLKGRTYSQIYSPSNRRYTLAGPEGKAMLRCDANTWYQRDNSATEITARGDSFVGRAEVPVWSSRMFVSEWLRAGGAPLEVSVSTTAKGYELECRNQLGQPLQLSCLASGRLMDLGTIEARQKRLFLANTNSAPQFPQLYKQQVPRMQSAAHARNMAFASAGAAQRLDDWQALMPFVSIRGSNDFTRMQLPRGLDLTAIALSDGALILFAAAQNAANMPTLISETPQRSRKMTVWRIILETRPAAATTAEIGEP